MAASGDRQHFVSLDGWRGISILLVLAAHLLPLGPGDWKINLAAGQLGMVLFFNLSGFLVASLLLDRTGTAEFLLRRFFRIVPLVWLFLLLVLPLSSPPANTWLAHFFFYANLPPQPLLPVTAHLWSVCVEAQFYAGMALLHLLSGRRGLMLLPLLCLGITVLRIADGVHYSSVTWYRIDEILAGSALALAYAHPRCEPLRDAIRRIPAPLVLLLLLLSCHPDSGFLNYLRPYFGALLVGVTLLDGRSRLAAALDNRVLAYIASISYALYVLHPLLAESWLGAGDDIEKYLKRPLLFALLFLLAHLSTRRLEQPCIAFGKRLARRWRAYRLYGSGVLMEK